MKKISININHFLTFSQLSAENVKNIILGLLAENIEGINDAECRGIARTIINENLALSEKRRAAKCSKIITKAEKQELSTQNGHLQSEQNEQSEQNKQISPLASPYYRMTKNKNINITQSGVRECGKHTCFNKHLVKCERVPNKTDEERKQFVEAFKDIFAEIDKFGYNKNPSDEDYDATKKIAKEATKLKYIDALYEVIDTFIEMFEEFKTSKYIHCGKEKLFRQDIAQMAVRCDYDVLYKILYQLAYMPQQIENHPYYILRSIWKNLKEKEKNHDKQKI